MSKFLRVYVTGEAPFVGTSKATGKPYTITRVYVHAGSKPFPEEVGVMDEIRLPAGDYNVPYSLDVYQGRLQVRFDFSKAVQADK